MKELTHLNTPYDKVSLKGTLTCKLQLLNDFDWPHYIVDHSFSWQRWKNYTLVLTIDIERHASSSTLGGGMGEGRNSSSTFL